MVVTNHRVKKWGVLFVIRGCHGVTTERAGWIFIARLKNFKEVKFAGLTKAVEVGVGKIFHGEVVGVGLFHCCNCNQFVVKLVGVGSGVVAGTAVWSMLLEGCAKSE